MRGIAVLAVLASFAVAQQPNSSVATMTIDGIQGPPYPIAANVPTATPAMFALSGFPGAPFIIAASATGLPQAGALLTAGGILDLPLVPPPVILLDGAANPQFVLDPNGAATFAVAVPPAGTPPSGIPLGHQEALQAALADPSSPGGFTLTAATAVTVVQGPVVVQLALGSDGVALIDLLPYGFSIPFYGVSYTQAWICANGFITFGQPDSDFTPSVQEFNTGYPRLAPFWTDLEQVPGDVIRYTINPNPLAGQPAFMQADWVGVHDWAGSFTHTFSAFADAAGNCRIAHSIATSSSLFATLCGIGPGLGLNPQTAKDLSAIKLAGGASGATNESFFEFFTGWNVWPGPGVPTPIPFDLYGITLNFTPIGTGGLPASTSAYLMN